MTFKEECLKDYNETIERGKENILEREMERITREKQKIIGDFERNFNRTFKKEYLKTKLFENGYSHFYISIDDLEISVIFQNSRNPAYYLVVHCHKCGEETNYRNNIGYNFLYEIGKILSKPILEDKYNRICRKCREEESDLQKQQREEDYHRRMKERNGDIIKRFADVIADILREGGYSDLYNEEIEH